MDHLWLEPSTLPQRLLPLTPASPRRLVSSAAAVLVAPPSPQTVTLSLRVSGFSLLAKSPLRYLQNLNGGSEEGIEGEESGP